MPIVVHHFESENESLLLEIEGQKVRVKHKVKRHLPRYLRLTVLYFAVLFSAAWTTLWWFWATELRAVGVGIGSLVFSVFFVILYSRFQRSRVKSREFLLSDKQYITLQVEGFDTDATLHANIKAAKGIKSLLFGYIYYDSFMLAVKQAEEIKHFFDRHTQLETDIKERMSQYTND